MSFEYLIQEISTSCKVTDGFGEISCVDSFWHNEDMVRKLELTFVIYPVQRITVSGLAVRSDKCPYIVTSVLPISCESDI